MGGRGSGPPPSDISKYVCVGDRAEWEQQPRETGVAYEAFVAYRDMGEQRSLAGAAKLLGKSSRILAGWSSRWVWRSRIEAWERELSSTQHEAYLAAAKQDAERKAKEKLMVADGMWQTAAKGLVLWNRFLTNYTGDGPPPIAPVDVQRLAEAGLKLSLLLEGKPTEIEVHHTEVSIEDRRKEMRKLVTNPQLRRKMKEVAELMKDEDAAATARVIN